MKSSLARILLVALLVGWNACAHPPKAPVATDEYRQAYLDAIWEVVPEKKRREEAKRSLLEALDLMESFAVVRRKTYRDAVRANRDPAVTTQQLRELFDRANTLLRSDVFDRYLEKRARLMQVLEPHEWDQIASRVGEVFLSLLMGAIDTDREGRFVGMKGASPVQARRFEGLEADLLEQRAREMISDEDRRASVLALVEELSQLEAETLKETEVKLAAFQQVALAYDTSPLTLRSRAFAFIFVNEQYESGLLDIRARLHELLSADEWKALFAASASQLG